MLSSIVFSQLHTARDKAIDARKIVEEKSVGEVLTSFGFDYNRAPDNHYFVGGVPAVACDDPSNPDGQAGYNASMQELVDAAIIKSIPKSVGTAPYCYFNYGKYQPDPLAPNPVLVDMGGVFFTASQSIQSSSGVSKSQCTNNYDVDFNNNGFFDMGINGGYDYLVCVAQGVYNTNGPFEPGSIQYRCDATKDGRVNRDDYAVWRRIADNVPLICTPSNPAQFCSCYQY